MNEIINLAMTNEKMLEYIKDIKDKKSPIYLLGLTDVAKTYFTRLTNKSINGPVCIITYNEIQAKKLIKDLETFTDGVYYFPKKEIVTYDYLAESLDVAYERIETLNSLRQKKVKVLVTTIEAVMQNIIPENVLYKTILELKVGQNFKMDTLKQELVNLGYERYDLIEFESSFVNLIK